MIRRTLEIASKAYLRAHFQQLIIQDDEGEHTVPFEDIGFLILDNPQITCSQSVLRHCARENIALIVTDEKHLPASLLLPLDAHSTQCSIMHMQASTPEAVQHALWQQIIQAKIKAQKEVLAWVLGEKENARLARLAKTVSLADKSNHEAQASRIYFKSIFGEGFKREQRGSDDINIILNYGYSLLRTACARALIGAGLHPAFGIHHHNQYNVFCLADDVMEPLRPLVDKTAIMLYREGRSNGLDRKTKTKLLEILGEPVMIKKREIPLMVALTMYSASLRTILKNHKGKLSVPTIVA